jgi:hypothetical protein
VARADGTASTAAAAVAVAAAVLAAVLPVDATAERVLDGERFLLPSHSVSLLSIVRPIYTLNINESAFPTC